MKRKKIVFPTQYDVIIAWMNKELDEGRLRRRYGESGLYFRGDYMYSGVTYPYLNRSLPWHKNTVLAKRITDNIYFMSKYKYHWCDCMKVPLIKRILENNKKKVYLVEDFEYIDANIESYRNSIKRLQRKLRRTRLYHEIYYDLLKNKIEEYNGYIKDFKIPLKPRKVVVSRKITTKMVILRLQGLYKQEENFWQGGWINRIWEE